jgi:hypothetical protein
LFSQEYGGNENYENDNQEGKPEIGKISRSDDEVLINPKRGGIEKYFKVSDKLFWDGQKSFQEAGFGDGNGMIGAVFYSGDPKTENGIAKSGSGRSEKITEIIFPFGMRKKKQEQKSDYEDSGRAFFGAKGEKAEKGTPDDVSRCDFPSLIINSLQKFVDGKKGEKNEKRFADGSEILHGFGNPGMDGKNSGGKKGRFFKILSPGPFQDFTDNPKDQDNASDVEKNLKKMVSPGVESEKLVT